MGIGKKLRQFILPKEINFFEQLRNQSDSTAKIITELNDFYVHSDSENTASIFKLITLAREMRGNNLIELNNALVTPVDKEAISRAYIQLNWVVLSVKHLVVEMDTYHIFQLRDYRVLLELLQKAMINLTDGFALLPRKKAEEVQQKVNMIIHIDNMIVKEYAEQLSKLFEGKDFKKVFQHREILLQLKEISKRIHVCSNQLEDLVFKMN